MSRSSICAILQQKCGHRVVQLGGVVCEEVKICLLREVTKKYMAALTSVENQINYCMLEVGGYQGVPTAV